jgi:hypothetical protein
MFKTLKSRKTLALSALLGAVTLSACSTTDGSSRYGGGDDCCAPVECVEKTDCGFWAIPIYQTVEVEVIKEVEKEVIKEVFKELPPKIIYQNQPCPPDTTTDANGACIRYVDRPPPCYGQPCLPPPPVVICHRKDGLPCKK